MKNKELKALARTLSSEELETITGGAARDFRLASGLYADLSKFYSLPSVLPQFESVLARPSVEIRNIRELLA